MAEDRIFLKHVNDLRSESERIQYREDGLDIGYQLPLFFFIFIRSYNSHFIKNFAFDFKL